MRLGLMKTAVVVALLACALPTASAATSAEDEEAYRTFMSEGLEILKSGKSDELARAVSRFKAALRIRPDSAEAYYWLALSYSDQQNWRHAATNAKDATVYNERMPEAWLLWGQILLYDNQPREALEKLEIASRLDPNNPVTQYNLGRAYYHGFKDPDAALPKFRSVWQVGAELRRQKPEFAAMVLRSRLYIGYCEFDRGRWDSAISAFRDVLNEQPGNFDAALRLALCYRHSNRSGECERILLNMRKAIPPILSNRRYLAEIDLQLGDLYLKDTLLKNSMLAITHLQEFVNQAMDTNHPALEPAREYLLANHIE